MNRRELLAGLLACGATVSTVESEPMPLLLVLKFDRHIPCEAQQRVRQHWEQITKNAPDLPPLLILQPGVTLEAIVDPRHATNAILPS